MSEPRPVHHLLLASAIGGGLVALWWLSLPPDQRLMRLQAIATHEGSRTLAPTALLDQAEWLWQHRTLSLQGLVGLLGVAGGIGLLEGMAWRSQDARAGFHQTAWTTGLCLLAVLPGVALGVLLAPWPLPLRGLALAGAGLLGVAGGLLGAGRPYTT